MSGADDDEEDEDEDEEESFLEDFAVPDDERESDGEAAAPFAGEPGFEGDDGGVLTVFRGDCCCRSFSGEPRRFSL